MSNEVSAGRRIYDELQNDPSYTLTKARAAYREAFGVPHNHKSIDEQYINLVKHHFGFVRTFTRVLPKVALPVRIALAFYLRELGDRKSKKSFAMRIAEEIQMEEAQRLKKEYMTTRRPRLNAYDAEVEAAEQVNRTFLLQGKRRGILSVNKILDLFRHPGRIGSRVGRGKRR